MHAKAEISHRSTTRYLQVGFPPSCTAEGLHHGEGERRAVGARQPAAPKPAARLLAASARALRCAAAGGRLLVAAGATACVQGPACNLQSAAAGPARPDSWARQAEVGSYMEDLQGFVFDESKCVTYKWLSTTLGVSADVSKRMLYEFAEANAAKLSAIYLVSGAYRPMTDASLAAHICVHACTGSRTRTHPSTQHTAAHPARTSGYAAGGTRCPPARESPAERQADRHTVAHALVFARAHASLIPAAVECR